MRIAASATGRSLVQRSPTGCVCVCVSNCVWSRNLSSEAALSKFVLLRHIQISTVQSVGRIIILPQMDSQTPSVLLPVRLLLQWIDLIFLKSLEAWIGKAKSDVILSNSTVGTYMEEWRYKWKWLVSLTFRPLYSGKEPLLLNKQVAGVIGIGLDALETKKILVSWGLYQHISIIQPVV